MQAKSWMEYREGMQKRDRLKDAPLQLKSNFNRKRSPSAVAEALKIKHLVTESFG